ncbi:MAG: hypothetical protein QF774_12020, partial [Nitrospinota bacterium]|nr:hypothetical protein [Nitrospinota bacterium]
KGGSAGEKEDEIQVLAARFVDLWQRQLEIMADDPALRQMMTNKRRNPPFFDRGANLSTLKPSGAL